MEHRCDCGSIHNEGELGVQYNLYQKIDKDNVECLNEFEEGSGVTVFKPWEERLNFEKYVESDADEELLFNIPFTGNVKLKGLIVMGCPDDSHPTKVKLELCQEQYKTYTKIFWNSTKAYSCQKVALLGTIVFLNTSSTLMQCLAITALIKRDQCFSRCSHACSINLAYSAIIEITGIFPRRFKNRPRMTFDDASIEADQEFELCKDENGVHEYPVRVVKFSSVYHLTLHFSGNNGAERTRINYIGMKGEWTPGHNHGVTICAYESRPQISDHVTDLNTVTKQIH